MEDLIGKIISLPVTNINFENTSDDDSERFSNVHFSICKDGLVPSHDLYIDLEAINEAKNSLENIPILCAYETDDEGNKTDFKGHEIEYKITQNGNSFNVKVVYIEQPVGHFTSNCNPQIENINGENWLTADGVLYSKYCDDAVRIIKENDNKKYISMEIKILSFYTDENNYPHINQFKFMGVTLLGEQHSPAIEGANVKLFTKELTGIEAEVYENILTHIKNNDERSDSKMDKETVMAKYKDIIKNKDVFEKITSDENISVEDLQKQLYDLAFTDLTNAIKEALSTYTYQYKSAWSGQSWDCMKYGFKDIICDSDFSKGQVIVRDEEYFDSQYLNKYYAIPYTIDGDSVKLNTSLELQRMVRNGWKVYETGMAEESNINFEGIEKDKKDKFEKINAENQELMNELNATKSKFTDLKSDMESIKTEFDRLKDFEENTIKAEKEKQIEEVMSRFTALKNIEGFEAINNDKFNMSLEELETKLKVLAFDNDITIKKNNMSKELKDGLIKFEKTKKDHVNKQLSDLQIRYGEDIINYINK